MVLSGNAPPMVPNEPLLENISILRKSTMVQTWIGDRPVCPPSMARSLQFVDSETQSFILNHLALSKSLGFEVFELLLFKSCEPVDNFNNTNITTAINTTLTIFSPFDFLFIFSRTEHKYSTVLLSTNGRCNRICLYHIFFLFT